MTQYLSARDVCARLGISERTFFRIAFFRTRKVRIAAKAVRYALSDVEQYEAIGRKRAA